MRLWRSILSWDVEEADFQEHGTGLKVGDHVRIIATLQDLEDVGIQYAAASMQGSFGIVESIDAAGTRNPDFGGPNFGVLWERDEWFFPLDRWESYVEVVDEVRASLRLSWEVVYPHEPHADDIVRIVAEVRELEEIGIDSKVAETMRGSTGSVLRVIHAGEVEDAHVWEPSIEVAMFFDSFLFPLKNWHHYLAIVQRASSSLKLSEGHDGQVA